MYREDIDVDTSTQKKKPKDKRRKKCWSRLSKEEEEEEKKENSDQVSSSEENNYVDKETVWQVVCFTIQDWGRLVEKFRDSKHETERKLYRTLSENFMSEIPRLFELKEKKQRCKILQQRAIGFKSLHVGKENKFTDLAMVKNKIKPKTNSSRRDAAKKSKAVKQQPQETPVLQITKKGRQTNNSLASADGQVFIDTKEELPVVEKKKEKSSGNKHGKNDSSKNNKYNYDDFELEERRVGMHKVLDSEGYRKK